MPHKLKTQQVSIVIRLIDIIRKFGERSLSIANSHYHLLLKPKVKNVISLHVGLRVDEGALGKTIVFGIFKRNGKVYSKIVPTCV